MTNRYGRGVRARLARLPTEYKFVVQCSGTPRITRRPITTERHTTGAPVRKLGFVVAVLSQEEQIFLENLVHQNDPVCRPPAVDPSGRKVTARSKA
jgi:hypothetical protein